MIDERADAERYTRRDFLRGAGLAAGALAATHALSALASDRAVAAPRRGGVRWGVAVMVPLSGIYPSLGANLAAGLRLGFEGARTGGRAVHLIEADIGVGQGSALRKVDELLEGGVELAVGLVSPAIGAELGGVFERRDRAFVAVDAGADVPRRGEPSPEFLVSLHLWQSSFAFGGWAAENVGREAMVVASSYDIGYDAPHAFRLGFERAGGEVVGTRVTHRPGAEGSDLGPAMEEIRGSECDFVYAAYCGRQAVEFLRAYSGAGLSGRLPLAGPEFLAGEGVLAEAGTGAVGVRTCSSWATGLDNAPNRRFCAAYRKKTGRDPDALTMLGYEAAVVISAAAQAAGGDTKRSGSFGEALANAQVAGPRGSATLNADGPRAPYVREVRRSGRLLRNAVVADLGTDAVPEDEAAELHDGMKMGWINTYLAM